MTKPTIIIIIIIIIMIIITKTIKIMKNYNHDGDKGHYNNK